MAEGTRKNPLEYEREYNEFMYKLRRFLASKDMPLRKIPLFGGEEIDLYLLYKTVTNLGGWFKITEERKWHEVASCFNLPPNCLNSAFALRQLYMRYLESYEKLYFLGEDGDDSTSVPRLGNGYMLSHTSLQHGRVQHKDPARNFERLVLSLQSGLPNEVDFAINICMLLSNVNNSVFNLAKAPAVVDMILAHVGVFLEDSYGSSDLYKDWYKNSGKDFLKFWKRVLNCDEIKELLLQNNATLFSSDKYALDDYCEEEIFNLDKTATHKDYELQRVLQVCTILHNFSFDKMDASVLSSHPICLRFLLFCLHSNIGSLKKLATDTMTNLAEKTVLEPVESLNTQLFFFMVDRYVKDCDRYNRICAMNILRKICHLEDNQESVCKALSQDTYETLIKVLILQDVQLLINSLETLYQLSGLGQIPCDCIVAVEKSIEILVSILNVCVESFEAESLAQVKVVDNYHNMVTTAGAKNSAGKVYNNVEVSPRQEAESEILAQHWLRAAYDIDPSSTILQRDLYGDYLTSCSKISRTAILNSGSFFRMLRFAFPNVQVVKLNTGTQQMYGLVGIRRKLVTDGGSSRSQMIRTPTPPMTINTSPIGTRRLSSPPVETNVAKVPQRPSTPPVRRRPEQLTISNQTQSPITVQPSSLPGQRCEMLPNKPQPNPIVQHSQASMTLPQNHETKSTMVNGATTTHTIVPSTTNTNHVPCEATSISCVISTNTTTSCDTTSDGIATQGGLSGKITGNHAVDNHAAGNHAAGNHAAGNHAMKQTTKATLNGDNNHVDTRNMVKCSESTVHASVINGAGLNSQHGSRVLYVAKEENASKMTREGHEVVIAVVENPTTKKPSTPGINTSDTIASSRRKRASSLVSDCPAESMSNETKFNGPFSASEMLRNVAKRQRCHSDGDLPPPQLVNGVSGSSVPRDTITWNDVPRTHPKSPLPSPKVPLNVNGVRVDLVAQHTSITPKIDAILQKNSVNHLHKANTVSQPGGNTPVTNVPQSVPGLSNGVTTTGDISTVTTCSSNVITTTTQPASLPGTTITTRGSETRGEQQAPGPYRCMWDNCECSFTSSKLLYNHAVNAHAPADQLFTSCQWEGCSNIRRSRASLLFHLRQRHLTPVLTQQSKEARTQKIPQNSPAVPPTGAQIRPAFPPHPSVNPLLLNLKEQLLQTEHESPLTKSIRLTAALILRNIAKYSPTARKKLKRFESLFAEIMCSRLESNGAMASCLHELTRIRQQRGVVTQR